MDDEFDAASTDVITEFGARENRFSYQESVTGYQNYVNEMERMLSGQMDLQGAIHRVSSPSPDPSPLPAHQGLRRMTSHSFASDLAKHTRPVVPGLSMSGRAMPVNARKVSGKRGHIELVEQKVMEDSPERTISLWRERVAQSSVGDLRYQDEEEHSEENSHVHRKVSSCDPRTERSVTNVPQRSKGHVDSGRGASKNMGYERSEVSSIVTVQVVRVPRTSA